MDDAVFGSSVKCGPGRVRAVGRGSTRARDPRCLCFHIETKGGGQPSSACETACAIRLFGSRGSSPHRTHSPILVESSGSLWSKSSPDRKHSPILGEAYGSHGSPIRMHSPKASRHGWPEDGVIHATRARTLPFWEERMALSGVKSSPDRKHSPMASRHGWPEDGVIHATRARTLPWLHVTDDPKTESSMPPEHALSQGFTSRMTRRRSHPCHQSKQSTILGEASGSDGTSPSCTHKTDPGTPAQIVTDHVTCDKFIARKFFARSPATRNILLYTDCVGQL